jgi:hypothetical protein
MAIITLSKEVLNWYMVVGDVTVGIVLNAKDHTLDKLTHLTHVLATAMREDIGEGTSLLTVIRDA